MQMLRISVIPVLTNDAITCKKPHETASPIGNVTSEQKEYPTPIIETTDPPSTASPMEVRARFFRWMINPMYTRAKIATTPISQN
jgi:hypothetical protein